MVAVLTFVCLVTLIKETTYVPVTVGHNLIKMGMAALVRQYSECMQDAYRHSVHPQFNIIMHTGRRLRVTPAIQGIIIIIAFHP